VGAGAVTIPIVVVSGLPIEVVAPPAVAFWHLLVGVVLLSMLFAGALLYWQYAPSQDVDLLPVPGTPRRAFFPVVCGVAHHCLLGQASRVMTKRRPNCAATT
jgi:hypothetical protein